MDRFVARENIRHYHEMLLTDIDRELRLRVHRLLAEEEDKLGRTLELLVEIERHIADGDRRIEAQQLCVNTMRADGHMRADQAQEFLDGMIESQLLSINHHRILAAEIDRNRSDE